MKRLCVLSVLFVTGCASMPVPKMTDPQGSVIAIQVETRGHSPFITKYPNRCYFVRIDADDDLAQNQVIRSNFAKAGRFYLLNAKPGKYAAVAVFKSKPDEFNVQTGVTVPRADYTTYFAKELIEATKVKVGAGEVGFMGSYVVNESLGLADAEPIQNHYANVLSAKRGSGHYRSRDYYYRGSAREVKQDDNTRKAFIKNASDDLAGGGWESILR